jgi:methionyl-tRNA synthetase
MPWKLGREKDTERLGTVLYTLEEVLRLSALLVAPVIPETAARIWAQLGIEQEPAMSLLDDYRWGDRAPGSDVGRKEVLFPRIDMKQWEEEKARRDAKKGLQPDPGEHEEEMSIDDFKKVELRVAKVISVDVVPKADKLYKIHLDLGYERRTIVSGIREEYAPEELEGMRIIVICNLKPATIRGVESKGMLLAAETPGGDGLALLTVDRDIPLGARVR